MDIVNLVKLAVRDCDAQRVWTVQGLLDSTGGAS
jgi:hypothetical protein